MLLDVERESRALHLSRICLFGYEPTSVAASFFRAAGYPDPLEFNRFGFRAWALAKGDQVTIAFEGSNDPMDWIANGAIQKVPLTEFKTKAPLDRQSGSVPQSLKVHRGFQIGADLLLKEIRKKVDLTGKRVTLTGHSLGGAIAKLSALKLLLSGINAEVYTFGAPNATSHQGAAMVALNRLKLFNYRRSSDLVPLLPPAFLGYSLAGEEIILGQAVAVEPLRFSGLWRLRGLRHLWPLWQLVRQGKGLKEHSIANYVLEMERWERYQG